MNVVAPATLFCLVVRFKMCYELLLGDVQDVVKKKMCWLVRRVQSQGTAVFQVEANALPYVQVRWIMHSHRRVRLLKHIPVPEWGLYI